MNTLTIEELDREEIEFLPPRVVMTTCQPRCCPQPCAPKCDTIRVSVTVRIGCLVSANATARA